MQHFISVPFITEVRISEPLSEELCIDLAKKFFFLVDILNHNNYPWQRFHSNSNVLRSQDRVMDTWLWLPHYLQWSRICEVKHDDINYSIFGLRCLLACHYLVCPFVFFFQNDFLICVLVKIKNLRHIIMWQ